MKELHWICGTIDVIELDEDILDDLTQCIGEIISYDDCYRDAEVFWNVDSDYDEDGRRHKHRCLHIYGQFSRDALKALKNLFKEFGVKTFVGW